MFFNVIGWIIAILLLLFLSFHIPESTIYAKSSFDNFIKYNPNNKKAWNQAKTALSIILVFIIARVFWSINYWIALGISLVYVFIQGSVIWKIYRHATTYNTHYGVGTQLVDHEAFVKQNELLFTHSFLHSLLLTLVFGVGVISSGILGKLLTNPIQIIIVSVVVLVEIIVWIKKVKISGLINVLSKMKKSGSAKPK